MSSLTYDINGKSPSPAESYDTSREVTDAVAVAVAAHVDAICRFDPGIDENEGEN